MIENVKYFGKLTAIALWTWIKINLLGFISLVITFTVSLFILFSDENLGPAAHTGFFGPLLHIIVTKPFQSVLFFLIIISHFFLFSLGNKYIIDKIVNRIVNDKSERLLDPLLDKALEKFKAVQPNFIKEAADFSLVKLKLIHQIKNETENKWQKRALVYGLEKVNLNNDDFKNQDTTFNDILKAKTSEALHNVTEPSRRNILLVLGLQWLCALLVWILN